MPDAAVISKSPTGVRWALPALGGAAASIAGLVALASTRTITFWPIAGLVTGLCVAGDRLLAARTASITVHDNDVRVRTHLGVTASRRLDELLTIEWHDAGWRPSVVLNFEHIADNIELSAQGLTPDAIEDLAQQFDKPFLRGASLYGDEAGEGPPS
jgi:hypothetical protein